MIQRMVTRECTWEGLRSALAYYFPDDVAEFDTLVAADNKRPAIKMLQNRNIISPDAWVQF